MRTVRSADASASSDRPAASVPSSQAVGPPQLPGVDEVVEVVRRGAAARRQDAHPGRLQGGHRVGDGRAVHHRQVPEAAGGRAHALAAVRVGGAVGEHHRVGAGGVSRPDDRAGVARVAHRLEHRDQARRGLQRRRERDVEQRRDAEHALRRDRLGHRCEHLAADRRDRARRRGEQVGVAGQRRRGRRRARRASGAPPAPPAAPRRRTGARPRGPSAGSVVVLPGPAASGSR